MKKIFFPIFFAILLVAGLGGWQATAAQTNDVVKFTIQLRDNVTVEMGAIVLKNSKKAKKGATILVLNGTGQTANTFRPLAASLFSKKTSSKVAQVILLDYPGHGNSGLPMPSTTLKFGDLTVADYVSALLRSLEKLAAMQLKPNVLLGHSLGAEIIQLAQQRLTSQGTNLKQSFGISGAIFLVPDIAGPLPWAFTANAGPVVAPLIRNDPNLGMILDIPASVFVDLFYRDRQGRLIANATTPDEAVAKGFISFDSATLGAELLGLPPFTQRPQLSEGIFDTSSGTAAGLLAFAQDGLYVFPDEHRNLYTFLTRDQNLRLFFTINDPDSVHNIHV
ncbi:MAG: alpha/beta fold hydrolase, partial [Acidobacteriota bacterium]